MLGLNLGPHACVINTLQIKPFLQLEQIHIDMSMSGSDITGDSGKSWSVLGAHVGAYSWSD